MLLFLSLNVIIQSMEQFKAILVAFDFVRTQTQVRIGISKKILHVGLQCKHFG